MNNVERAAAAERRRAEEQYRRHQRTCWDCYRLMPKPGCPAGRELRKYADLLVSQQQLLADQLRDQVNVTQEPLF